jgi:hypothetical protein
MDFRLIHTSSFTLRMTMEIVTNKGTQNLICVQLMRTTNKLPIPWIIVEVKSTGKISFSIILRKAGFEFLSVSMVGPRYGSWGIQKIACNYFSSLQAAHRRYFFLRTIITLFHREHLKNSIAMSCEWIPSNIGAITFFSRSLLETIFCVFLFHIFFRGDSQERGNDIIKYSSTIVNCCCLSLYKEFKKCPIKKLIS